MHISEHRGGDKISQGKVRCLSQMFRFLRRLVSCVEPKVRYTLHSSIFGDSPPSKTSKHDTKKCLNEITAASKRTRDRRQRLPPTPKSSGRSTDLVSNPFQTFLRLLAFLRRHSRRSTIGVSPHGEPGIVREP